ncbi:SH3 domain-containing protein, partial [Sporolactobacillus sp. THM19-2]|uniref:SH3 domain-containing protein n=1 Tax=Sporolactobacillus sp. THM19-2 TaxID=2511171 RepID=UPI0013EA3AC6
MNPNRNLTILGAVTTAAAVAAVSAVNPLEASADSFKAYTGQAKTNLNIRSTPGTDHDEIGMLNRGDTFSVIGVDRKSEKGHWLKIKHHNRTAFVDGYYVAKAKAATQPSVQPVQKVSPYQGVTTDWLHVRFLPGKNGTILTTLKPGATVTVTGKTASGWLQVNYQSGSAYVSAEYIKTGGSSAGFTERMSSVKTLYTGTTTDNLNVRPVPGTSRKPLTTLKRGTRVDVTGEAGGGWLKIKYNGGTAYVSGDFVTKANAGKNPSAPLKTLYTGTTTDNLNVRPVPGTSRKPLTTLKKGTKVDVTGEAGGGWLKIKYNGGTAYVSGKYVT